MLCFMHTKRNKAGEAGSLDKGTIMERTSSHFTTRSGFTLIEFIGVLLLLGAGLAAVINAIASANARSDATEMANSVGHVVSSAQTVHKPTFGALTCQTLAQNGVFNGTSWRVDRAAGFAVFYNDEPTSTVTCAPANLFGTNDAYVLTFANMTNSRCSAFVDRVGRHAWVIAVNGTSVKAARGTIDAAVKGEQCEAAGTDDVQTVAVTLARQSPPQ